MAPPELQLLYDSIREDGYTMPIVCYHDQGRDIYIIIDGFHRYRVMLDYPDIYQREEGQAPCLRGGQALDCRMAAPSATTRPRGSHNVDLMSNIIQELHELGRSDAWISKHLGMDRDEILRLKQLTGLTALFRDVKFSRAWQAVSDGLKDEPEEEEEPALSF